MPRNIKRRHALGIEASGITNLHDYYQASPRRRTSARKTSAQPIVGTDDWPERVPIVKAEVRVFESYLRKELDDLFGPLP